MSEHITDIDLSRCLFLQEQYREGLEPERVIELCLNRIDKDQDYNAWHTVLPYKNIERFLDQLSEVTPNPLWGVPFSIKDNIDLAGVPTTAGCPEFSYTPDTSAPVVAHLLAAGAIPIGKTHMDQFATGLNGTRSRFGPCKNSLDSDWISGGSSSGSAVAVARGHVTFALGTDTAGSGRVPAALNDIVGFKPSRGLLSTVGSVPACRSLDCVSVFGNDVHSVTSASVAMAVLDENDLTQRCFEDGLDIAAADTRRIAVPRYDQLEIDTPYTYRAWEQAVEQIEGAGYSTFEIDISALLEAGQLLYNGPWLAERYAALREHMTAYPDSLHSATRSILESGQHVSSADGWAAFYRIETLKRSLLSQMADSSMLLLPTVPATYTLEQMQEDPIALNGRLGLYTQFMNLLDWCGISLPLSRQSETLPFGVTLCAPAGSDRTLLQEAAHITGDAAVQPTPERGQFLEIAVCGAHLSGEPLNPQLRKLGATLAQATQTSAAYRFYRLPGDSPKRPGLVRCAEGQPIEVEVWRIPKRRIGALLEQIKAPLGLGQVELIDGAMVHGFVCEANAIADATDITDTGGWRAYLGR